MKRNYRGHRVRQRPDVPRREAICAATQSAIRCDQLKLFPIPTVNLFIPYSNTLLSIFFPLSLYHPIKQSLQAEVVSNQVHKTWSAE